MDSDRHFFIAPIFLRVYENAPMTLHDRRASGTSDPAGL